MIADAPIDSGVLSVVATCGLVATAITIGIAWGALSTKLNHVMEAIKGIHKRIDKHENAADDHRVEDDARHAEQGARLTRLEIVAELTPIHGVPTIDPRPVTGKQDWLRGNTPRPRVHEDSGDTGSGYER